MREVKKEVVNGITLLAEDFPYLPSCALGVFFNLGSRDEDPGLSGITHFIEHLLFKGTRKRSAKEISLAAESVGANIDGFTTKEVTGIYGRFLKDFTKEVLELLIEIVTSPVFPEEEMEKEKNVIYQEIREDEEDPEESVFLLLFRSLFPNHPLGSPITGTYQTVKEFTREKILAYFLDNYKTDGVAKGKSSKILFVLTGGNGEGFDLLRLKAKGYEAGVKTNDQKSKERMRARPNFNDPSVWVERRRDLASAHLILARPIFSYPSDNRYPLSVLNTALGGSVSSRLFQKLREEEGLVYQISSFADLYSDCGVFGIYFVTHKKDVGKALTLVKEVLEKSWKEGFSAREIEVAQNLTKSAIILSQESPLHRMFSLAKLELVFGESLTLEEVLSRYQRVGWEDVNFLGKELLKPTFSIVGVGDLREEELRVFL